MHREPPSALRDLADRRPGQHPLQAAALGTGGGGAPEAPAHADLDGGRAPAERVGELAGGASPAAMREWASVERGRTGAGGSSVLEACSCAPWAGLCRGAPTPASRSTCAGSPRRSGATDSTPRAAPWPRLRPLVPSWSTLGTALTVDAVRHREGAGFLFLGGAIAPGPRAAGAQALAQGAARLPLVEPSAGPSRPGPGHPEEAMLARASRPGLPRRRASSIARWRAARRRRWRRPPWSSTGGASVAYLLEPDVPSLDGAGWWSRRTLVHLGLLAAAAE